MHGFALNLTTVLDAFSLIVPCGIRAYPVGSVASLAGSAPEVVDVALAVAPLLARGLDYRIDEVEDASDADDLHRLVGLSPS